MRPVEDGCSNTISTVQKDNLIAIPINTDDDGNSRTIKSQYAKTSKANFERTGSMGATGALVIEKITEGKKTDFDAKIVQIPRGFNNGGNHEICPTIGSHSFQENNLLINDFKIRKLTPKECLRLMDVSEENINIMTSCGVSNSQLYKMAGNSIVVNCIALIFNNLKIIYLQD